MDFSELHSAELKKFVQDHLREDPALLLLKFAGKVDFDLKTAVQQISARQKASKKLPEWTQNPALFFPPSLSLEQSSSEETARHKAQGLSGNLIVDLTGGFGVDAYYLSKNFKQGIYCEYQPELFKLTKQNLEILAPGKFQFYQGDGLTFLKEQNQYFDLIYADPARRGKGNQKLYKIQDCEPDLVSEWEVLKEKSSQIILKYSPMLDISQAWNEIQDIQKITILSVKNEVKELLIHWNKNEATPNQQVLVQDIGLGYPDFSFSLQEEKLAQTLYSEPKRFLIEPHSGILKAGAFKLFGQRLGLQKLETNSHLYTSEEYPVKIPGKVFEVIREVSPKKKEIKKLFPSGKVNVITRNYASGSEALKKKLGLKDGGDNYLIGTKTQSGFKIFWCRLA
ncbi:class I SAM-dependent methyltransferase [Algoriphagus machipongonensis]|uniref:Uncharacterized protein n=1 Tax=Algoriphagus machipongonensis TaxID=388413 RepID=A3HVV6_9BACT|nr:class I SAM-dependent methyltransferase [Algoriphagus machipongonensis]EAZ82278.1 hypothetical protein ALPR1_03515 [Algoriphagus machipongonensis]